MDNKEKIYLEKEYERDKEERKKRYYEKIKREKEKAEKIEEEIIKRIYQFDKELEEIEIKYKKILKEGEKNLDESRIKSEKITYLLQEYLKQNEMDRIRNEEEYERQREEKTKQFIEGCIRIKEEEKKVEFENREELKKKEKLLQLKSREIDLIEHAEREYKDIENNYNKNKELLMLGAEDSKRIYSCRKMEVEKEIKIKEKELGELLGQIKRERLIIMEQKEKERINIEVFRNILEEKIKIIDDAYREMEDEIDKIIRKLFI